VPAQLGVPLSSTVHDVLLDERLQWRISPNYIRVEPCVCRTHVNRVEV
jgi:hypothetical protein